MFFRKINLFLNGSRLTRQPIKRQDLKFELISLNDPKKGRKLKSAVAEYISLILFCAWLINRPILLNHEPKKLMSKFESLHSQICYYYKWSAKRAVTLWMPTLVLNSYCINSMNKMHKSNDNQFWFDWRSYGLNSLEITCIISDNEFIIWPN